VIVAKDTDENVGFVMNKTQVVMCYLICAFAAKKLVKFMRLMRPVVVVSLRMSNR